MYNKKGKGYELAEREVLKWHAPGLFDKTTGQPLNLDTSSKPPKYQDVFGKTIIELAKENDKIMGVTLQCLQVVLWV